MNYNEFSEKIKAKYPQYKDMDNRELAQKMVAKYPQYSDITFDDVEQDKQHRKGFDLTPSGMSRRLAAATVAPFYAAKTGQGLIDAYKQARQIQEEQIPKNLLEKGMDIGASFLLPQAKVLQAGKLAPLVNNLATGAYQGGLIGGIQGLQEGKGLEGTAGGAGIGGAINVALPFGLQKIAEPTKRLIENPKFQNALTSTLEALTSVPKKYSQLALNKELAGQSILKGKFDPETAYRGVEQNLRLAKDTLPNSEYFANRFYELGQKAKQGIEKIKSEEGYKLGEALDLMDDKAVTGTGIQQAVGDIINSYGKGGVYNSAVEEAPHVVNYLENNLTKEGLTHRDLDRIKNRLYDMGYAASQNREGTAAEVARGTAEQINNYLRGKNPAYVNPNDKLSLIHGLERDLGGINSSTIGGKLQNLETAKNLIGGLDEKLQNIDNVLPAEGKFIDEARNLVNSQNQIENIQKLVGNKYLRNPRLLSNVADEATEQALTDLQRRTNVNFMDELNNVRAREALEALLPGQGGGSGSAQGFGNLLRTSLMGGLPTLSVLTHNPLAMAGLAAVSPRIMAKGTIQNIGGLYQNIGKEIPDYVKKLMITGGVNLQHPERIY